MPKLRKPRIGTKRWLQAYERAEFVMDAISILAIKAHDRRKWQEVFNLNQHEIEEALTIGLQFILKTPRK